MFTFYAVTEMTEVTSLEDTHDDESHGSPYLISGILCGVSIKNKFRGMIFNSSPPP